MKIKTTQTVDVPVSPWCEKCQRQETDKNGIVFCTLYNRFVFLHGGKRLKCLECYMALYHAIDQEEG